MDDIETNSCSVYGKGRKKRELYFDAEAKLHLKEYIDYRNDNKEALFVTMDSPCNELGI